MRLTKRLNLSRGFMINKTLLQMSYYFILLYYIILHVDTFLVNMFKNIMQDLHIRFAA